jgi:hypothetical protein
MLESSTYPVAQFRRSEPRRGRFVYQLFHTLAQLRRGHVKRTAPANIFKQASLTIETCSARIAVSQVDRYISALLRFQFIIQIQGHSSENIFAFTHNSFFRPLSRLTWAANLSARASASLEPAPTET